MLKAGIHKPVKQMETKQEQKAVLFTNWTSEDFSWQYGGVFYDFKAGQSTYLQDYLAQHFAKHLVDRELNKDKLPTNSHLRGEYERKCYGVSEIKAESKEKLESTLINELPQPPAVASPPEPEPVPVPSPNPPEQTPSSTPAPEVKKFCDSCDSKGVRHKKVCPKYKPIK